jgi:hypothetical protein
MLMQGLVEIVLHGRVFRFRTSKSQDIFLSFEDYARLITVPSTQKSVQICGSKYTRTQISQDTHYLQIHPYNYFVSYHYPNVRIGSKKFKEFEEHSYKIVNFKPRIR